MDMQFLRVKDFLKLGFTSSLSTCSYKFQQIKKITKKKHVHYTDVASYFGISEAEVLRRINS